ncbi:NAD(+)/NADH kinase [Thermoleophilia bacterium SCSIO 60948]|nr:NAD(+)/NADH kinase [Thermoleophilia bacterium SCSIO 60948]
MRTATILTHTHPEQTREAIGLIASIAREHGCDLYAEADELERHPSMAGTLRPASELDGAPDLCIVLGGDGTILRALRRTSGTGTPVFGFNFGTVGFLAATGRDRLDEAIRPAFEAQFEVMAMPGLSCEADVEHPIALNDISIVRQPERRVAELEIAVGGTSVGAVRCDGVVAATPAGSTGYNLANQGPIMAWGVTGYVVSFIAPHTLTARALVVAPEDVLEVRNAVGREAVDVVFDGAHETELGPGEAIEIRFFEDAARLAQPPGSSFYRRVLEKFGPLAR